MSKNICRNSYTKVSVWGDQYTQFKVSPYAFVPWCTRQHCSISYGAWLLRQVRLSNSWTTLLVYFTTKNLAHICACSRIPVNKLSISDNLVPNKTANYSIYACMRMHMQACYKGSRDSPLNCKITRANHCSARCIKEPTSCSLFVDRLSTISFF